MATLKTFWAQLKSHIGSHAIVSLDYEKKEERYNPTNNFFGYNPKCGPRPRDSPRNARRETKLEKCRFYRNVLGVKGPNNIQHTDFIGEVYGCISVGNFYRRGSFPS